MIGVVFVAGRSVCVVFVAGRSVCVFQGGCY